MSQHGLTAYLISVTCGIGLLHCIIGMVAAHRRELLVSGVALLAIAAALAAWSGL